MSDINFFLKPKNYTLCGALCPYSNVSKHWKKGTLGNRFVAILEAIPFLGSILAIVEKVIFHIFQQIKEKPEPLYLLERYSSVLAKNGYSFSALPEIRVHAEGESLGHLAKKVRSMTFSDSITKIVCSNYLSIAVKIKINTQSIEVPGVNWDGILLLTSNPDPIYKTNDLGCWRPMFFAAPQSGYNEIDLVNHIAHLGKGVFWHGHLVKCADCIIQESSCDSPSRNYLKPETLSLILGNHYPGITFIP